MINVRTAESSFVPASLEQSEGGEGAATEPMETSISTPDEASIFPDTVTDAQCVESVVASTCQGKAETLWRQPQVPG